MTWNFLDLSCPCYLTFENNQVCGSIFLHVPQSPPALRYVSRAVQREGGKIGIYWIPVCGQLCTKYRNRNTWDWIHQYGTTCNPVQNWMDRFALIFLYGTWSLIWTPSTEWTSKWTNECMTTWLCNLSSVGVCAHVFIHFNSTSLSPPVQTLAQFKIFHSAIFLNTHFFFSSSCEVYLGDCIKLLMGLPALSPSPLSGDGCHLSQACWEPFSSSPVHKYRVRAL